MHIKLNLVKDSFWICISSKVIFLIKLIYMLGFYDRGTGFLLSDTLP